MKISMHELRSRALRARREMSEENRARASRKICDELTRSREFLSAAHIACYLPLRDEVDTRLIIARAWRANKRIFVPVTHHNGEMLFREIRPDTTLLRNRMAIWEPQSGDYISPRELQLVVTPTVAFDKAMHRIGMGGGYYDRCFSFLLHRKHWIKPKLAGLAFKCQEIEEITPNTWDVRLYRLFSEVH
jgi:5-formyltetrahydrofolate cyclo-ligase